MDETVQETRVRFGDRPTQTMPLQWAETMLSLLMKEHPAQFAKLLPRAAMGESNGHRS